MQEFAQRVAETEFPPIAEAFGWLAGRKSDKELLNMCQAVPSYPPAPALQQEIARLALEPGTGGYTDIFGIPELREGFARHLSADYAAPVAARQVAITTGCNQAFAAAIMVLAQAGDNVVMPAPFYFNHQMWLRMMGVAIKPVNAFAAGGAPSVEESEAAIDGRTKAIMLCSPNNPSGAIYPPQVLEEFYELAKRRGIALIIDETYKDFRPGHAPAHGILQRDGWDETLIQLFSFSKIYALAGYRLGALVAGPKLLHEAAKVLDCMTICPPQITQRAVVFALTQLDQWKEEKRQLMAGRLAALREAFSDPRLKFRLVSSGAYFAYVQHPFTGEASKDVAKRLAQQHDVLCLPGSMFGPGQENFLRFAFANVDKEKMALLVERLVNSQ
ncbi:MAG: aminotransferase [Alphaproteobacteria bacterium]|nr:aminotransferase [Alphaproteobacteria bacterium]